ncbi:MAG: hypothetical protein SchgKO_11140 [Schleiferiaceae bacterium]
MNKIQTHLTATGFTVGIGVAFGYALYFMIEGNWDGAISWVFDILVFVLPGITVQVALWFRLKRGLHLVASALYSAMSFWVMFLSGVTLFFRNTSIQMSSEEKLVGLVIGVLYFLVSLLTTWLIRKWIPIKAHSSEKELLDDWVQ